MTVLVPWNDILCFLVVVSSIFLSIWMLLRHEENDGTRKCSTKYESLLIPQPDKDNGNVITSEWTQPNHVVSNQLWTSCWRNLNPVWLLVTRFLSFVIMARVLAWDIQLHGKTVFLYYTKWTFALVVFYFALGTIASAQGCLVNSRKPVNQNNGKNSSVKTSMAESSNKSKTTINFSANKVRATVKVQSYHEQDSIKEIAGFWGYLMQTVYQTCAGAVILTDTIFWFLIVPSLAVAGVEMNLLMGCMHSLNAVFLLIDTALNSLVSITAKSGEDFVPILVSLLDEIVMETCLFVALPVVSVCIFLTIQLYVWRFLMGSSRMWWFMVALPIPRSINSMGTSMVLLPGPNLLPLLRIVCSDRKTKEWSILEVVPSCVCEHTIALFMA
ncbi:hypothetical protein C5167_047318 [Papaver somniferum]|uniref:Uncharacterized protein n=1 Tax=Papaver somniferum TaxID=3469 RepID=A0A4Y7IWG9_PAPSO|nr:hypothetical protein C5167_011838 [Papaver somniferum]RZC84530.1 hypothetical protein C5167_047318 [Papaver somniferum]